MKYKLKEHGDFLEKQAGDWVEVHFPFYERVWSRFTGHKGNGVMADMPDYPDQDKRTNFSQRSYTVLQSAMIIRSILDSGIFEKPHTDIVTLLEFHKSLIAFYACIGRIKDCVIAAADHLQLHDIKADLSTFYAERNIILHGCTIPLSTDDMGLALMPDLKTWDDKKSKWADAGGHEQKYIADNTKETFRELMMLLNENIYGRFYDVICKELKELGIVLEVESSRPDISYIDLVTSGTTHTYTIVSPE